ncbi:sensor histidine kinase [Massilia sp. GCM10020059]|uniref:histidine kinase n=1 Tax=Massilia agrisoli TaxID=2892444 RepID=A0ABS8IVD9_9BURK|nr:sensor histidine kinase [Massilia agrisoli]MCC6072113.1 sensor histidine kinase [Massilia agrisoli]
MNSIRLRLLKWLIGPILVVNLAGAALTYLLAWTPAQLAFDQGLADAAHALAARVRQGPQGPVLDFPAQAEQLLRADRADATYFAVRRSDGALIAGDAAFAAPGAAGVHDGVMGGEPVRVASTTVRAGRETVQVAVAKTLRKRGQIRSAAIRALVLVEGLFTLALVGLIWFSVTSGLLPLSRMRANLNARDGADLEPIADEGVPYELSPVVSAFNDLLGKVEAGARAQHDFLANVAHQLRTPLAGMKLQLEWLGQRHAGDADSVRSVGLMLQSNERMIRQTNQLLALARAEPSRFEKARLEPIDLSQLVAEVVQYFVEEAAKKQIDIGFDLQPALVAGDSFLLRDLVDNLVDNAVRYTPVGGTVTVRCLRGPDGGGVLEVEDSGPGIPAHQRALVFQRFMRLDDSIPGSGLGLAIVRDIAQAHGARIELADGAGGAGVVVAVRFAPV